MQAGTAFCDACYAMCIRTADHARALSKPVRVRCEEDAPGNPGWPSRAESRSRDSRLANRAARLK